MHRLRDLIDVGERKLMILHAHQSSLQTAELIAVHFTVGPKFCDT